MDANTLRPEQEPNIFDQFQTQYLFPESGALETQLQSMRASSPTYQAALGEIQTRSVQPPEDKNPAFGWTEINEGTAGLSSSAFIFADDLGVSEGYDQGLLGVVVRGIDEQGQMVQEERFELVQKPSQGIEDPGQITVVAAFAQGAAFSPGAQASTIWSRFRGCVESKCISTCQNSLVACAGAWPVYLKCVAAACGGCALKCGACAGCECSGWCRWASGCCR